MATCKNCNMEFDLKKGWRNECPKEFCSWYCCHDYQHKLEYQRKLKNLTK